MASQSAALPGAAPADQSALGWLILIPLGCLILGQALLAITGVVPVLDGSLADSDAYMRLARVLELHDSGNWFDSRFPRINPPEGHVQHWTRPLDALLLAGAWLLQPFLGFERALHLWGVLISPALLALAMGGIAWAAAPALDRDGRLLACLLLLLQPAVLAYTSVARPDHHSLLLFLAVTLVGLSARLATAPQDERSARLAGAVAALGVWVSPEALTFVAVSLAALGLFWLADTPGMARANRTYLLTTAACLAVALVLERGPIDLFAVETDRLSIVHVLLFSLIAGFWCIATGVESRAAFSPSASAIDRSSGASVAPGEVRSTAATALKRAVAALAGVAAIALIMVLCFPELRHGPLGEVDPLYAHIRLQNIIEIQPLVPAGWLTSGFIGEALERLIMVLGIGLLALPSLALLLMRSTGAAWRFWAIVTLAVAAFVPLAFYQVRWASYAEAFLVWPYAAGIVWLLGRLSRVMTERVAVLARPLLTLIALFWTFGVAGFLPQMEIESAGGACPLDRLAPVLNRAMPAPSTLLAYADYGSELLYRTPHNVLSIPNHRPQPGFAATWRILTATDDRVARSEAARFGVDWILLCPSATERWLFSVEDANAPTLYQRLADGDAPDWLRPVPLDEDLAGKARLFEVLGDDQPRTAAAGTTAR